MKKSTILAFSGLIITFFIVTLLGNRTNVYEKQKRYDNPKEAIINFIGYINSYEEVKTKNGFYNITPNEFLESISKRYRLYLGENNNNRYIYSEPLPLFYSYELEEVSLNDSKSLEINYEDSFKGIPEYKIPNEVKVYKLNALVTHDYSIDKRAVKEDGTVDEIEGKEGIAMEVYLVIVNEGEGYVVDYYSTVYK